MNWELLRYILYWYSFFTNIVSTFHLHDQENQGGPSEFARNAGEDEDRWG